MRYSIETAPRDGKVVILEDVASVTFDVAHWSPEVGRWVDENGEPSKIRPTHWFPLARDKYLLQENEGSSNPCRDGPSPPRSRWPFAASSITAAFVAAALVGVYFRAEVAAYVMRYAGQQSIVGVSTIGEQVAEADQDYPQAVAQEAAQAKQAREAPAPRQSLDKEQRAEVLANELAQARRAINRLNLQLRAGAANSAELLGQEREKTGALVQAATAVRHELEEERALVAALASELAMARSEAETYAALLNKTRDETKQLKQATEKTTTELQQERERTAAIAQEAAAAREELTASAAQHRQALDEERARGAVLASELTTALAEIETQSALLRKARDETGQLKQAEAARSAQSLEQERERAVALAREAAAARQELIASTAQHRRSLDQESARHAALWSELAVAQREIETQAAQLREASDETRQLKQATENRTAELQQERDSLRTEAANSAQLLGQERERTAAIAQEAAAARHEFEEERARGAALASELVMARGEIETLLNKARDDAAEFNPTTAELQEARDSAEALWKMAQESARRVMEARTTLERTANSQITQVMQTVDATAPEQPEATVSQNGPEAARLMVRARGLLGQGNIGAARIVLEHVAETGSAQASFALAETYDPVILFTWGTYGTRGDATKARELYAKAHAGGIREAKNRFDALDQ